MSPTENPRRTFANLSPDQVIQLQDALLANADRLLSAALLVLEGGDVGLADSLAILGMEESAKAIALHERRVEIAYAPEGELFFNARLEEIWANHQKKLKLVHRFLVQEQYWFGTVPANPEQNHERLGKIDGWKKRHDKRKQRGLYVEIDKAGNVLTPDNITDRDSLLLVINYIHQIGWQLRLGEHIEAKAQAQETEDIPPAPEEEIEEIQKSLSDNPDISPESDFFDSMRAGKKGRELNNDAYRLHLPESGSNPFANLGKRGYEAETRELIYLAQQIDEESNN